MEGHGCAARVISAAILQPENSGMMRAQDAPALQYQEHAGSRVQGQREVRTPVQIRLDRDSRPVDEQRQDVRFRAKTKLQALAIGHLVDLTQSLAVYRRVRMV